MSTTTATARRQQERWREIVCDPALRDLPYKVETNAQGQIIVSPHKNTHSFLQEAVQNLLNKHAPEGFCPPEFAIVTPQGVKTPDVVWVSPDRRDEMEATGDPTTLAPELCVEVMSETNTEEEMQTKRTLYRDAGAEEVWIVAPDGTVRFFGADERGRSSIAPDFPTHIST